MNRAGVYMKETMRTPANDDPAHPVLIPGDQQIALMLGARDRREAIARSVATSPAFRKALDRAKLAMQRKD